MQAISRRTERPSDIKRLRAEGVVPGVLYGFGEEAKRIQVKMDDLHPVLKKSHGTTLLIDLRLDEEKDPVVTVIREVQRDPLTRKIVHCDLLKVDMNRKYNVTVPVVVIGESPGVKTYGGIMDQHVREVDIRCRPLEIPESYVVDVSKMEIGDSVRVGELAHGHEEILTREDVTVVMIVPPRTMALTDEEAAEAAEGAEGEEGEEGAEKKAEGESAEKSS
ncbi:MAG: 50S ribosomal protein L25 [Candidatus Eisenbacteria bacterium]|nr:50S ribosomal protein L25 [Candidatus Eisenbacteria bacterium]